jgi:hypothetical protein
VGLSGSRLELLIRWRQAARVPRISSVPGADVGFESGDVAVPSAVAYGTAAQRDLMSAARQIREMAGTKR